MIKRLKSSLTTKIFLITVLMLVMICVLTYGFIAWVMPMTYNSNLNSELTSKAQQLIAQLEESTLVDCQSLLDQFSRSANANVYISNSQDEPVKSSAGSATISEYQEKATVDEDIYLTEQQGSNEKITSYNIKVASTQGYKFHFSNDGETYTLTITNGMEVVNQVTKALSQIFPWLILTILAVSLLGALYYSRYITRPIVKVSGVAKQMSELDFDWRCDDTRCDEIGMLGKNLNIVGEKLCAALSELRVANLTLQGDIDKKRELERQRLEFFSAVSHELKTPITVVKGQLEGMLANVGGYKDHEFYLAKCLSVVGSMEGMVQEILSVTRMDSTGFAPQMELVNLTALVKKQLDANHDLLEQKYLSLYTDLTTDLVILGDLRLLQKAVSNLISNAAKYSPMEEAVYVRLFREKDIVILTVKNTGVHIPEKAIPHLFKAFFRVEPSRNRQTGGSGLGLYLVFRIAKIHSAECRIENYENGVRVTLCFPLPH